MRRSSGWPVWWGPPSLQALSGAATLGPDTHRPWGAALLGRVFLSCFHGCGTTRTAGAQASPPRCACSDHKHADPLVKHFSYVGRNSHCPTCAAHSKVWVKEPPPSAVVGCRSEDEVGGESRAPHPHGATPWAPGAPFCSGIQEQEQGPRPPMGAGGSWPQGIAVGEKPC